MPFIKLGQSIHGIHAYLFRKFLIPHHLGANRDGVLPLSRTRCSVKLAIEKVDTDTDTREGVNTGSTRLGSGISTLWVKGLPIAVTIGHALKLKTGKQFFPLVLQRVTTGVPHQVNLSVYRVDDVSNVATFVLKIHHYCRFFHNLASYHRDSDNHKSMYYTCVRGARFFTAPCVYDVHGRRLPRVSCRGEKQVSKSLFRRDAGHGAHVVLSCLS